MTITDICDDQYIDYQDKLYANENGRLEFRGDNWALCGQEPANPVYG